MRDVLDVGDKIPVLVELVAEAAELAEVPAAARVDPVRLVTQRRGVDRGAELALEEEPLVERNAPGEAGEAVAGLAAGIDHRADIDARIEEPGEPGTTNIIGVADRRRQEFAPTRRPANPRHESSCGRRRRQRASSRKLIQVLGPGAMTGAGGGIVLSMPREDMSAALAGAIPNAAHTSPKKTAGRPARNSDPNSTVPPQSE